MDCRSVQKSLSTHLDGKLAATESRKVRAHVQACPECEVRLYQTAQVRAALAGLCPAVPPVDLTAMLRITASRERERRIARRNPIRYLAGRLRLWADGLMRPVALPAAGGLISALLLFALLVPSISFRRFPIENDVSLGIFTDPSVKSLSPFGFTEPGDYTIEVDIDRDGRMVDFRITQGPHLSQNSEVRRSIENDLLFTEFSPATAFGRPISGKLMLSLRRVGIFIRS